MADSSLKSLLTIPSLKWRTDSFTSGTNSVQAEGVCWQSGLDKVSERANAARGKVLNPGDVAERFT